MTSSAEDLPKFSMRTMLLYSINAWYSQQDSITIEHETVAISRYAKSLFGPL